MGRKRKSDDRDYVNPTKYPKVARTTRKPPLPPTEPPANWQPLEINNPRTLGEPHLPEGEGSFSTIQVILHRRVAREDCIPYERPRRLSALRRPLPWKDAQLVLYATTVADQSIVRNRRRPAGTATNAESTRRVFGNAPRKELPIPTFIDQYNHGKCGVDLFDQTKAYYSTQRKRNKTWRPLFYFLIDVVLNNIFRLSSWAQKTQENDPKKDGHKEFLHLLAEALLDNSTRLPQGNHKRESLNSVQKDVDEKHGYPVKLYAEAKTCVACIESGRVSNGISHDRGPLREIPPNTVAGKNRDRTARSRFGCKLCKLPLCRPEVSELCWPEHLLRAKIKRDVDTTMSSTVQYSYSGLRDL
ncbi:hypothetical protein K469DRAFT_691969 [Zopfia rhizophila CBS 207.26]|uniref:PiggyBac transposable element-derived protein domain-containing protein n=1 Tax=Zopfia rhizophila CBS 207.26 TaxID=1314779 RepID=A0A6A6DR29_9PEZI|nr:hypothetical protein K469DRAFT_691969 [Zopfia rhizophila CBS 207.26]